MSTPGVSSTVGDTMMSVGGYHEYTGGCSVHWDFHTNSVVFPMTVPTFIMISLQCTHDIPQCTEHPPLYCTPPVYCTDIMQGDLQLKYLGMKSNYVKITPEHKVVAFKICVACDDDRCNYKTTALKTNSVGRSKSMTIISSLYLIS